MNMEKILLIALLISLGGFLILVLVSMFKSLNRQLDDKDEI